MFAEHVARMFMAWFAQTAELASRHDVEAARPIACTQRRWLDAPSGIVSRRFNQCLTSLRVRLEGDNLAGPAQLFAKHAAIFSAMRTHIENTIDIQVPEQAFQVVFFP
jgi:hypothetical protein